MKKIILSLSMIAIVAVVVIGATGAFFSDTETSTGNTFTAGAIDLKIDSAATYNGAAWAASTWTLKDLSPTSDKFFDFADIKPGDAGTSTVSLHVINNDAWVCAAVSNLASDDNGLTEPEAEVDTTDGAGQGELQSAMAWNVWKDTNGNGAQDPGETVLASGSPADGVYPLYDSTTAGGPLTGSSTAYLGVSWSLPASSGNETQTDSLTGDISFTVVQSRNNEGFVCSESQQEEPIWVETTQADGDASLITEGVLQLTTANDTASRVRYTNSTLNVGVAGVTLISYDSKQVSAVDAVNGNATMRLTIDKDGDILTPDTVEITYEPYYNIAAHNSLNDASIVTGAWQTWETTLAQGKFWANGGFLGSTPNGGAYATNFTLAQVAAAHPSAKIVGISFGMGTWNAGQVVLVDNASINATAFDFAD